MTSAEGSGDLGGSYTTDPTGRLGLSQVSAGLILSGRYRLDALLVHSRNIMTWRAIDQVLSRPVLIHLLEPEDPRLGPVLQAAREAATVSDARFLRVLDAMEAHGQEPWSFVVCEYAVGDSVQQLLADGPLSAPQAAFIVSQVAQGLAPLHARGLFHLRISPDSVIITGNGNIKVVGLLVDAALRPEAGEDELGWGQREAIDMRGLGALLYSCLCARWPVPPTAPQRVHWGLPPAPLLGLPPMPGAPNEQVWPAPHELDRSIDPQVSGVAMAALRPSLGIAGPSLCSVDDLVDALDSTVDPVEAEESLEQLVLTHNGEVPSSQPPAVRPGLGEDDRPTQLLGTSRPLSLDDLPTAAMAAVPGNDRGPAPAAAVSEEPDPPAPTVAHGPVKSPPSTDPYADRPAPVPAPPRQHPQKATAGTIGRRWLLVLAVFAIISLIVLQARGCAQRNSQPESPTTQATTTSARSIVTIASASDFDPVADGGDANENAADAHFAIDGDPATAWHTLTYYNNPAFGGLKPGAGIVFDLGQPAQVIDVTLTLSNAPCQLQLMVPTPASTSADKPPMNSVKQWQTIASDTAAGTNTTLTPASPVQTRWVLVYFTKLPAIGNAQYRSGIAEAVVHG